MKKNYIASGFNILFSIAVLVAVFLLKLNPLGLITAFIVTIANVLLSVYSMGIESHPVIRIGKIQGSAYFFHIATFLLQVLTVVAALTNSLWISLLCLFGVLVYLECISLFLKELFQAMRFHIAVTLSVSFTTLLFYCLLRLYREHAIRIPCIPVAILVIALYIFLMLREKDFLKLTAYSALFGVSVLLLSLGTYASQNIYATMLCLVSFTPVMFLLLLSAFTIEQFYKKAGEDITSVFAYLPIAGTGYLVGLLAILGFPPFSLFFGRLTIFQSGITAGNYLSVALMAVVFIVSTYFLLTKSLPKLFGEKKEQLFDIKENKQNNMIILALLLLIVVLSLFIPEFIDSLASDARAYVLGVLS